MLPLFATIHGKGWPKGAQMSFEHAQKSDFSALNCFLESKAFIAQICQSLYVALPMEVLIHE